MATATATKNKPPVPPELRCQHCGYHVDSVGSMPAHVAMAHKDADPSARNDCAGSNHVPGCSHFPASPAALSPSSAGEATTEPNVPTPDVASTPSGQPRAMRGRPEPGVPGAAIAPPSPATLRTLPVELLDIGDNVRVDVAELEELAASIAEHGVLQPIKATGPHADGRYLVVWGQRRTRASQMAGLAEIPAIVLPPDADVDAHGAARSIEQLVENLHRADLNPVDRARAMRAVVDSGVSQAELAKKLGIGASTVSNDLRILTLAEPVLERIRTGEISASHGKAMAALPPKQQESLARMVVERSLSSKDLERDIEWKRQEAENDEAKAKRTEKLLPKVIAALEAAGVPKDAEVGVSANEYSIDRASVWKALRAAGWENLTDRYRYERPKSEAAKCNCTGVRLDIGGRSPVVVPTCSDDRHRDRERNVDHRLEEEARKAFAARQSAVQLEVERQLRASGLAPAVLGLLEKAVRAGYYGNQGAKTDDLPAAVALHVCSTWQVRELITPELLAELGIEAAS